MRSWHVSDDVLKECIANSRGLKSWIVGVGENVGVRVGKSRGKQKNFSS